MSSIWTRSSAEVLEIPFGLRALALLVVLTAIAVPLGELWRDAPELKCQKKRLRPLPTR